jgi:DNA topoisomerase-1
MFKHAPRLKKIAMTSKRPARSGYTLVVCEKPDAARRVAEALSSGPPSEFKEKGVSAYRAYDGLGKSYVVCAASGHLFGPADTVKSRRVYPAFDLEWFPLEALAGQKSRFVSGRIRAIASLAGEADRFVNACDLDVEGEAIGYNILRYACGGRHSSALRAKFSSLTKDDVVDAFREENLVPMDGRAGAGRLRHSLDFFWGVNLSRALTEPLVGGRVFRTVSMGRVQGPALNFVVEREGGRRIRADPFLESAREIQER